MVIKLGGNMRITGCEILHCNAGWRDFSFLKLTTDENIIGIAEFNECYGSPGLSGVIRRLVDRIKDMDAIAHERIHQYPRHVAIAICA